MGLLSGVGAVFSAYKLYFIGAGLVGLALLFLTKDHYKSSFNDLWSANEAKQIKIDAAKTTVEEIGKVRAAGARRDIDYINKDTKRRMKEAFRIHPKNGVYTRRELQELGGR